MLGIGRSSFGCLPFRRTAAPQMDKIRYFEDLAESLLSTGGLSNVERKKFLTRL